VVTAQDASQQNGGLICAPVAATAVATSLPTMHHERIALPKHRSKWKYSHGKILVHCRRK
jgi:hypothetical protein